MLDTWCDIDDTMMQFLAESGLGFFRHGAKVLRPVDGGMEKNRK